MSVQLLLPTYDFGKRPERQRPIYKVCPCRHCTIRQKDVDIRHMKHARIGRMPNCPMSAEISVCGHAHACDAFSGQAVHLVVDSGELGQPDDAFCLEGMARRRTYTGAHAGKIILSWRFWCWIFIFVSLRATLRVPRSLGD